MPSTRKVRIIRDRFKEVKKIKGKTIQQFCIQARVKYETVRYCLRNGAMMPDILDKLARVMNCDVGYLTGEHSYIYDAELDKRLNMQDHEICGVDSNGIMILVYAEGKLEITAESALEAFTEVMQFFREAFFIEVDSGKGIYTFDDYLRDREEVEFYNNINWQKKTVPNWSEINTSECDYTDEFEIMEKAITEQMRYYHDNKEKMIQQLKEEVRNNGKH